MLFRGPRYAILQRQAVAAGSGNDSYTKLLAHFDNNLTDSSSAAKTITSTGAGSTRSSTQSKFGGYSEKLDGTTAYLSVAHDTDINWSGDFSVDCWIWTATKTADTQFRRIWARGDAVGGAALDVSINTSGFIDVISGGAEVIIGTTDLSGSTWHHIEISRSGSSVKAFINGTQEGSTWTSSANFNSVEAFYVGIYPGTLTTGRWNGYIDELRISNGIARHTTTFTPPTAAYS